MSVRVRFAPSPTGPLHIGGVRTALYNYLYARKHNGAFVLRIEDTDQARYVPGAEEYIIEALQWSGLVPDEGPGFGGDYGPYRQSERSEIYRKYVDELIENGHAYYAFDTPEELEEMREYLKRRDVPAPKYDKKTRETMRNSLTLSAGEVRELLNSGAPYTVRLRVGDESEVKFDDLVRGEVRFDLDELDDKVLMKADGMPTYHLANVVDDHLMKISHVIRGEEWVSSTGHHILLYRAFGWEDSIPQFAHLPLILKPTGQGKLSKRDGVKFGFPVFPIEWDGGEEIFAGFRESGFLPEAMINFLALMGWHPSDDQEIFSMPGLTEAFSIDRITKSGARFDYDKALWFNSQYIAEKSHHLDRTVRDILQKAEIQADDEFVRGLIALYAERVTTLNEFAEVAGIYRDKPSAYDEKIIVKKWSDEMGAHFSKLADILDTLESDDRESLETAVKSYIKESGLKFGDMFQLLRTAVSGSPKGPDLFSMILLLGNSETAARMKTAIDTFEEMKHGQEKEA